MNASLRVDRLSKEGSADYECRLIHEGDEIAIILPLSHPEGHAERLRAALFGAKGAALHVEPGWGSYLVQAAMRFAGFELVSRAAFASEDSDCGVGRNGPGDEESDDDPSPASGRPLRSTPRARGAKRRLSIGE